MAQLPKDVCTADLQALKAQYHAFDGNRNFVRRNSGGDRVEDGNIRSNIILSQLEEHRPYGGVVPEIAARSHLQHLPEIIRSALKEADLEFGDLTGVAATAGPGLIGGVMVGLMAAKSIALVHDIPFAAVHHMEAHALTARLTDTVPFPYLALLVSGGHCQRLSSKDREPIKFWGRPSTMQSRRHSTRPPLYLASHTRADRQ